MATGLYRQYCLSCHGPDGRGSEMRPGMSTIPDFSSGTWQEGVSAAQLTASVLDGKGTLMPAFRGRVSDDQTQDLVAYARAFGPAGAPTPEAPPDDFQKRFAEVQAHWRELQRQFQQLSKPAPKK